ncbi:MAG: hypothetical protein ACE5PV_11130 [Candidatus Poribacteria bacterium]
MKDKEFDELLRKWHASTHPSPEEIADYVQNALDEMTNTRIETHIEDCTTCKNEVMSLQSAFNRLESELEPMWENFKHQSEKSGIWLGRRWFDEIGERINIAIERIVAAFLQPAEEFLTAEEEKLYDSFKFEKHAFIVLVEYDEIEESTDITLTLVEYQDDQIGEVIQDCDVTIEGASYTKTRNTFEEGHVEFFDLALGEYRITFSSFPGAVLQLKLPPDFQDSSMAESRTLLPSSSEQSR